MTRFGYDYLIYGSLKWFVITMMILITMNPISSYASSGQCLANAPSVGHNDSLWQDNDESIEWTIIADGVYGTTITYDGVTLDRNETGWPCTVTTRVHNGSHPSPTLIVRPGNQYQVLFINNLGPESSSNPTGHNEYKDPNTTNIHTHGLHISAEAPSDSVFTTVYPGNETTYIWDIPCDHRSGTFWYHPHHHGSTTLQVGCGGNGALMVEQESKSEYLDTEGMPDWLYNLEINSLVIVIQSFDFGTITNLFESSGGPGSSDDEVDSLTSYETAFGDATCSSGLIFHVFNGVYLPTICLVSGEFTLLKFINADIQGTLTMYLYDSEADLNQISCELYLISKDGILLDNGPRNVSHIWLITGSRADMAIKCTIKDSYTQLFNDTSGDSYAYNVSLVTNSSDGGSAIATLSVSIDTSSNNSNSSNSSVVEEISDFVPIRPPYLADLRNLSYYDIANGNDTYTVEISNSKINDIEFEGEDYFLDYLQVDKVYEWLITRNTTLLSPVELDPHPFHMHVYPFQVIDSESDGIYIDETTDLDIPVGWHMNGDYLDVMHHTGTIRFVTDTFGGHIVLHCHKLLHEDLGAMGQMETIDGCDGNYSDYTSDDFDVEWDNVTNSSYNYNFSECNAPDCEYISYTVTTSTDTEDESANDIDVFIIVLVIVAIAAIAAIFTLAFLCYRGKCKCQKGKIVSPRAEPTELGNVEVFSNIVR